MGNPRFLLVLGIEEVIGCTAKTIAEAQARGKDFWKVAAGSPHACFHRERSMGKTPCMLPVRPLQVCDMAGHSSCRVGRIASQILQAAIREGDGLITQERAFVKMH